MRILAESVAVADAGLCLAFLVFGPALFGHWWLFAVRVAMLGALWTITGAVLWSQFQRWSERTQR
jgi:hypothetical protein